MAYTNVQSGEIPEGTQYYSGKLPLGDYTFYLSVDASGVSPKIVTRCESPDGEIRTAASRTWPAGTQVTRWSVEANETEASVYVTTVKKATAVPSMNVYPGMQCGETNDGTPFYISDNPRVTQISDSTKCALVKIGDGHYTLFTVSDSTGYYWFTYSQSGDSGFGGGRINQIIEKNQQTAFYRTNSYGYDLENTPDFIFPLTELDSGRLSDIAWEMMYGSSTDEEKETLVARFAIDLGDAGGYPGGAGGWTQPGDWNPVPTTILHLAVNGALSGRHNDPLTDPSYSYLPADNTAEAGYGCGGDGGHGGGGGGGASTVIAEQFATNKANSKVIVVTAKRHGYGSGGSKGAKGGDGCIMIYY